MDKVTVKINGTELQPHYEFNTPLKNSKISNDTLIEEKTKLY